MTLAATDPANPYGAALPWPALAEISHRTGRKAGGLVVLVDGDLALYLERGGKTALAFTDDEEVLFLRQGHRECAIDDGDAYVAIPLLHSAT